MRGMSLRPTFFEATMDVCQTPNALIRVSPNALVCVQPNALIHV